MSTRILESLVVAAEMTGTELSKAAIRGMEMELNEYPEDAVLKALARCRRELKYKLTLADIIERLSGSDGRPAADEAWGKALLAFDEHASVVLNDDISRAMQSARPMYEERDKVGARMAFRSAYERIVQEARDRGEPVSWWASLGHDPYGRELAVKEGVEQGLLPSSQSAMLLPPPGGNAFVGAIAGLLAGPKAETKAAPDDIRAKLLALRDEFAQNAKSR